MRFASSALLLAIFVYYVALLKMWCTGCVPQQILRNSSPVHHITSQSERRKSITEGFSRQGLLRFPARKELHLASICSLRAKSIST
jgi:hypothetical protein